MSETEAFTKRKDSFIAGISVRGTVALLVCATVCSAQLLRIDIDGLLQTVVVLVFGYYYGQRSETKP
jgi:hypothetical protein